MDSEETRIYIAILITCLVLGGVFLLFSISIIRQQRRNLQLQKQQATAEMLAMEKERSRIAADLHDEVAPYLTMTRHRVSELSSASPEDEKEKEEITELLDQSLEKIREISFNLIPAALIRKGLVSGLEELVAQLNRLHPITIALVTDKGLQLDEEKTIQLFRIAQEMLHNTIKHAAATEVLIVLIKKDDQMVMKMADNGKGFDMDEQMKRGSGYGLKSIQQRVQSMGGKIFVQTGKGIGCSWIVELRVSS